MQFQLIAAVADNRIIGNKGKIPWNFPEYADYVSRKVSGQTVIVGRKTFELSNLPVAGKLNIVLSKDTGFTASNVTVANSVYAATLIAKNAGTEIVIFIGGSRVFTEAIGIVSIMHITRIYHNVEGDREFPEFDETEWLKTYGLMARHSSGILHQHRTYYRR